MSQDSSVSIMVGYGLDGWSLIPPGGGSRYFTLLHHVQIGSWDYPAF
jgi:hypothetical protein